MANAVDILRAGGNRRPEQTIEAARLEGVELAVAATILQKESYGGRNVWGSDGVSTGGTYDKGAEVTRGAYLNYRNAMRAKRIGRQGVGPCQATSAQYQDVADELGGCWDPVANMRSGFRGMGALIRQHGPQQGARRYNGSGPAAEAYGRDFMAKLNEWRRRLQGAIVTAPARPASSSGKRPTLRRGSTGAAVRELQQVLARWYPAENLAADGDFGPGTERVLRRLQQAARITVDGIAGGEVYAVLGMS